MEVNQTGGMDEHTKQQMFPEWLARHRGLLFKVVRSGHSARSGTSVQEIYAHARDAIWIEINATKHELNSY